MRKIENVKPRKMVRLVNSKIIIPNIYDLEKIGAGHDGSVFRCQDLAIKLLKYDVKERKTKGLMSFDKADYFQNLSFKRILAPIDTILDEDGVYAGYVMEFVENISSENKKNTQDYKAPGDFTIGDFVFATAELQEDFIQLSDNNIVAKDINRGSYIYSQDFLYLCDTDKYIVSKTGKAVFELNSCKLNFAIAKFLFYEMQKSENYNANDLKILNKWVKKVSNSKTFLKELNLEFGSNFNEPIKEYTDYKLKQLIKN